MTYRHHPAMTNINIHAAMTN